MDNYLVMSPEMFRDVRSHILQSRLEQVAFGFAKQEPQNRITMSDVVLITSENLEVQKEDHIRLSDAMQAKLIKHAWDTKSSLVEFHSHPMQRGLVYFSHSDLYGFSQFVPHVWWRLKGRPYIAVVMGPRNFDALIWYKAPTIPECLDYIQAGRSIKKPTGATLEYLERGLYGKRAF